MKVGNQFTMVHLKSFCAFVVLYFLTMASDAAGQTVDSLHVEPLELPSISVAHELAWKSGVFGHTFGYAGWLDGIAPMGRNPNRLQVRLGDLRLNDGFTGIPRLDLVPAIWLNKLDLKPNFEVSGSFDSLASPSPYTLVRYESSGGGGQAVRTIHVQNRRIHLGSTPVKLQTAFGYAGESGTGEYDGSALRRSRDVSFKVGLKSDRWSVELFDVASRRRVGAHAGVLPINESNPSSIYQRLGATVQDEDARRKSLRNDLVLTGKTVVKGFLSSISSIWTRETLDFGNDVVRQKGVMDVMAATAHFSLPLNRFSIELTFSTRRENMVSGSIFPDEMPSPRTFTSALVLVEGTIGPTQLAASLGPALADGRSWSELDASAHTSFGNWSGNLTLHRAGRAMTWHELEGFGSVLSPSSGNKTPIEQFISATLSWQIGLFSFSGTGLFEVNQDVLVTRMGSDPEDGSANYLASVEQLDGSTSATSASFELGFRKNTSKGIWATFNPVFRSTSSDDSSDLGKAWRQSMPSSWAAGSLGWKAILFDGDLDLNVYARARVWSEMGGLRLHTPTGILALPFDLTQRVEANWLVDFVAEAGIRGAIVFLSRENAFSGTNLLFGNLIVPDYPLAEQRTRFGVYWPINN